MGMFEFKEVKKVKGYTVTRWWQFENHGRGGVEGKADQMFQNVKGCLRDFQASLGMLGMFRYGNV